MSDFDNSRWPGPAAGVDLQGRGSAGRTGCSVHCGSGLRTRCSTASKTLSREPCLRQVWIFKGKRAEDELYRGMWERAMDEMLDRLVYKNEASGLTYVAEIRKCAPLCSAWARLPPA